jgi:hypothetical protein
MNVHRRSMGPSSPARLRGWRASLGVALFLALALIATACGGRGQRPAAGAPAGPSATTSLPATTSPSSTTSASTVTESPEAGTWRRLPALQIDTPYISTSVWTGTEFLMFGRTRTDVPGGDFDVAAAYKPATDTWRMLPAGSNRPGGFEGANKSVWTGSEMLVWGITNKAFDPVTNRWRSLSEPPEFWGDPAVLVWTGTQMIGWGGGCCDDSVADGIAYTPASDSWKLLPRGPLAGRQVTSGAWTGTELILVGGAAEGKVLADAAAYNPATRSWRSLPPMPEPRSGAKAVWDGAEVLVVGGGNGDRLLAGGVAYIPSTNRWRALPAMEFPRDGAVAVWTGSQLLVWGGRSERAGTEARPRYGEAYDPATNRWSPLPVSPLRGRAGATAVWTGTAMIVWGGSSISPDPYKLYADGAAYTPGAM